MAAEVTSAARWSLKIKSVEEGTFKDVSGFDSETEVIDWRETSSAGNQVLHKVPGNLKWSNIVCRRGVTDSVTLQNWRKDVEGGKFPDCRKDVTLDLLAPDLKIIATYALKEAWPSKLKISDMSATSTEYVVEELEICHIGMTREK